MIFRQIEGKVALPGSHVKTTEDAFDPLNSSCPVEMQRVFAVEHHLHVRVGTARNVSAKYLRRDRGLSRRGRRLLRFKEFEMRIVAAAAEQNAHFGCVGPDRLRG